MIRDVFYLTFNYHHSCRSDTFKTPFPQKPVLMGTNWLFFERTRWKSIIKFSFLEVRYRVRLNIWDHCDHKVCKKILKQLIEIYRSCLPDLNSGDLGTLCTDWKNLIFNFNIVLSKHIFYMNFFTAKIVTEKFAQTSNHATKNNYKILTTINWYIIQSQYRFRHFSHFSNFSFSHYTEHINNPIQLKNEENFRTTAHIESNIVSTIHKDKKLYNFL